MALIPLSTTDALFVFNETTGNFQAVTLQGQVIFRIAEPLTLATLLNFTLDPRTHEYRSEDPVKLNQRIINVIQMHTRNENCTSFLLKMLCAVRHALVERCLHASSKSPLFVLWVSSA